MFVLHCGPANPHPKDSPEAIEWHNQMVNSQPSYRTLMYMAHELIGLGWTVEKALERSKSAIKAAREYKANNNFSSMFIMLCEFKKLRRIARILKRWN